MSASTVAYVRVVTNPVGVAAVAPHIVALMLSVPTACARTWASALVTQPCCEGYSGWFGVVVSGDQVGLAVVWGFPSMSALRIAVIGRHRRYVYLESKHAMPA